MLHAVQDFFNAAALAYANWVGAPALAYASWLEAPAIAYALWFILGALWAVLICEYRTYRRQARMVAHIGVLETELMHAEDRFLSEQRQNDCIRAELLDLLAAARSKREHRPREVGDFASGRSTANESAVRQQAAE